MRPVIHALALSLLLPALAPAPASARPDLPRKLEVAAEVYRELLAGRDRRVPEELLEEAVCVAVIPNVIKGAFWWGGRHGRGALSCRAGEEGWSPPIFVEIGGASFGLQFGAESTDLVLFFMTDRGVRSLLDSTFTLGGDAGVAAGPFGRSAEAATDLRLQAEIYSYARSRGLFAGLSIEGSRLSVDQKSNRRYYGERLWADEVLFEHRVPDLPAEAAAFRDTLNGR